MTSKTTYCAFDGTEFDDYNDCANYENEQYSAAVKMWTVDGDSTTNLDKVHFVHLPNEGAGRAFLAMLDEWNYITKGIDGCGWYMWDDSCKRFISVDVDLLNTLFTLVSNEVNKAEKPLKVFRVDAKKIRSFDVRAVDEDEAIEVACMLAGENPECWIDHEVDEFEATPVS